MRSKALLIISVVALVLILVANNVWWVAPSRGEITVGNKNFTEQHIVGQLMKQLLEDRGFTVKLKSGRSSTYLREGIGFGDIDIYWRQHGLNIPRFYHLYSKKELQTDIKQAGLDIIKIEGVKYFSKKYYDNYFAIIKKS